MILINNELIPILQKKMKKYDPKINQLYPIFNKMVKWIINHHKYYNIKEAMCTPNLLE